MKKKILISILIMMMTLESNVTAFAGNPIQIHFELSGNDNGGFDPVYGGSTIPRTPTDPVDGKVIGTKRFSVVP